MTTAGQETPSQTPLGASVSMENDLHFLSDDLRRKSSERKCKSSTITPDKPTGHDGSTFLESSKKVLRDNENAQSSHQIDGPLRSSTGNINQRLHRPLLHPMYTRSSFPQLFVSFDTLPAHVYVSVPQHALLDPPTVEWIQALGTAGLDDAQQLTLAIMRSTGSVTNAMLRAWGCNERKPPRRYAVWLSRTCP